MLSAPLAVRSTSEMRGISNKTSYVIATARDYEDFSVLSVYKSIRCDDDDSWMRPVVAEADGRCVQWMSAERIPDDAMVGASAIFLEYIVFRECPGSAVNHACEAEVRKSAGVPVSESAQRIPGMRVPVLPE